MARTSLKNQFKHAILTNSKLGDSKRADRLNGVNVDEYVYSKQTLNALIDRTNHLSKYVKENFPDVKYIKDITPAMFSQYFESQNGWNHRTRYEILHHFKKIEKIVSDRYSFDCHFTSWINVKKDGSTDEYNKVRNRRMTDDDYQKILNSFSNSQSNGAIAMEIARRVGLRVNEIAHLKRECINIKKGIVEIREGAKNGRYRDVPIKFQDRDFFIRIKKNHTSFNNGSDYVTGGVKADSLNRAIRRKMEIIHDDIYGNLSKKYDKTTTHAIRKLWAYERMVEVRGEVNLWDIDREREIEAYKTIQGFLGHSDRNFREELYKDYIEVLWD